MHDPVTGTRPAGYVVALTGGIASGKSAAAERFRALGIHVHDADEAARAAVAPGSDGLAEIVEAFGPGVLRDDGSLDRAAVRDHVFADADARRRLEAIVHPRVNQWLRARAATDTGPYCILAIPLLAETWPRYDWVDRVAVVDAPDAVRHQRLMRRDDVDAERAQRVMDAQATRERRLALADDVIDNAGSESALIAQVDALHRTYLQASRERNAHRGTPG